MKRAIIVLLILAAAGTGGWAYYMRRGGPEIQVITTPVTRGDLIDTVGSTGTVQAVTTVTVGSQVSGNISWLGADFNAIVHKGQEIAKLDPSLFEAQLQQARANLNQTRANLNKAQSDLERNKVQLLDVQQKYARAKELAAKSLVPQSELDASKIAVDSAQASLQSQQATVKQVEASVSQSEASLNQNQVNLDHTVITAPIDGIVTQRSVDVGQTVAASMSAPTLFIIAADLTKTQINANIDESDVGRIRPGQTVTFRVDAYPGEEFGGSVAQVRLQPKVVQNVTTYETIINVPNPDLKLKPGMTANLRVQIAKRTDALRVPNAALRFRPTTDIFTALNQTPPPEALAGGRGGRGQGGGRGRGGQSGGGGQGANAGRASGVAPAPGAPVASARQGVSTGAPIGRSGRDQTPGDNPFRRGGRGGDQADGGNRLGGGGQGGGRADGDNPFRRGGRGGDQADGGNRFARGGQDGGQADGGNPFGRGGRGSGRGGGDNADRQAGMLDRFKSMSPDEQKQFIDRMKSRGQDVSLFEQAATKRTVIQPKYGEAQSAATIDALFAPLPTIETSGRAWLYVNDKDKKELKPVNLRLGITDGTNTELVSGDLEPGAELVTGVIVGNARQTPTAVQGNPLLPQGGRGRDGFGGFGGGGGRGR